MYFILLLCFIVSAIACGQGAPATDPSPPEAEPLLFDFSAAAYTPQPLATRNDGRHVWLRELYTLRRAEDFRIADFLGFNAVIEDAAPGKVPVFELARRHDFAVTEASWIGGDALRDDVRAELARYIHEPALISLNLYDEPDLRQLPIANLAQQIHAEFPGVRTSVTLAGTGRNGTADWPSYAGAVDIIRVDPYPLIYRKPLRHVYELVRAARLHGGPDKPIIAILQGWTYGDIGLPTADQLRHMLYQAIIAGATGYSIFDWNLETWSQSPEYIRELMRLNAELARIFQPPRPDGDWRLFASPPIVKNHIAGRVFQWRNGTQSGAKHALFVNLATDGDSIDVTVQFPEASPHLRQNRLPPPPSRYTLRLDPGATHWLPGVYSWETPRPFAPVWPFDQDYRYGELPYSIDLAGRPLAAFPIQSPDALSPLPSWPPGSDPDELASWRLPAATLVQPYSQLHHRHRPFLIDDGQFTIDSLFALDGPVNRAALRHRLFPGGDIQATLRLSFGAAGAVPTSIRPIAWHAVDQDMTGPDLAPLVTTEALPIPGTYSLRVHLPADRAWQRNRDHLLTLRLAWRRPGDQGQAHTDRVIRFRIDHGYQTEWTWDSPQSANVRITPTFPDPAYPPPEQRHYTIQADGIQTQLTPDPTGQGDTYRVSLSPQPDTPDSVAAIPVQLQINHGDSPVSTTTLTNLHIRDRQLIPPGPRPPIAIPYITRTRAREGSIDDHWQPIHSRQPQAFGFLSEPNRFAEPNRGYIPDHQAWFTYSPTHLICHLRIKRLWTSIRATIDTHDNRAWGNDDVAMLLIRPKLDAPDTYLIQLNPLGAALTARADGPPGINWNPDLHIQTHISDARDQWRAVLSIPWDALGSEKAPPTDQAIGLNIAILQSIAPRQMVFWSPWIGPDQAEFWVHAHLTAPPEPPLSDPSDSGNPDESGE